MGDTINCSYAYMDWGVLRCETDEGEKLVDPADIERLEEKEDD